MLPFPLQGLARLLLIVHPDLVGFKLLLGNGELGLNPGDVSRQQLHSVLRSGGLVDYRSNSVIGHCSGIMPLEVVELQNFRKNLEGERYSLFDVSL